MTEKLVFMHIPKNGGTSLRSLLSSWYEPERRCPYREGQDYLQNFDEEQLHRYGFFTGHLPLYVVQRFFPTSITKFTVLRDPVERAYSLYAYWRDFELPDERARAGGRVRHGSDAIDKKEGIQEEGAATKAGRRPFPDLYPNEYAGPMIAKQLDFGSFLFSNHPYVRKALTNPQTRFLSNARIYDHIEGMDAEDVIRTVVNDVRDWNVTVGVLEETERMAGSISRIAASLGVCGDQQLPHENRSERRGLDDLDRVLVADFLKMTSPLDFLLYEHFRNDH